MWRSSLTAVWLVYRETGGGELLARPQAGDRCPSASAPSADALSARGMGQPANATPGELLKQGRQPCQVPLRAGQRWPAAPHGSRSASLFTSVGVKGRRPHAPPLSQALVVLWRRCAALGRSTGSPVTRSDRVGAASRSSNPSTSGVSGSPLTQGFRDPVTCRTPESRRSSTSCATVKRGLIRYHRCGRAAGKTTVISSTRRPPCRTYHRASSDSGYQGVPTKPRPARRRTPGAGRHGALRPPGTVQHEVVRKQPRPPRAGPPALWRGGLRPPVRRSGHAKTSRSGWNVVPVRDAGRVLRAPGRRTGRARVGAPAGSPIDTLTPRVGEPIGKRITSRRSRRSPVELRGSGRGAGFDRRPCGTASAASPRPFTRRAV